MTSALVILQYNLFCRPSSFFWDRQRTRAQLIADNIYRLETHIRRSIDIITVCEAFDHQARNILCTKLLKQGFYYHTAILGDGQNMDYLEEDISSCFHLCRRCLVTNGGVMVFSRHPLEYHQQYLFHSDQIEGSDSLANKGAIYIRFQKNKQTFHLFATHLQAWNSKEAQNTRVAEFRFLQEKMKNIWSILVSSLQNGLITSHMMLCCLICRLQLILTEEEERARTHSNVEFQKVLPCRC